MLLNLNVGEVGNYCKHESCGLMRRLQCYSIVASFQGLCYSMSDYYFKNALTQKAEKQSIHNSEVFIALQYQCTGHPSRTGAVGAARRADGPLRAVPPHLSAPSPSLPALQLQRPAPSPGGFSCASCQACWLPSLEGRVSKGLRAQGAQRQYLSTRLAARAGHGPPAPGAPRNAPRPRAQRRRLPHRSPPAPQPTGGRAP